MAVKVLSPVNILTYIPALLQILIEFGTSFLIGSLIPAIDINTNSFSISSSLKLYTNSFNYYYVPLYVVFLYAIAIVLNDFDANLSITFSLIYFFFPSSKKCSIPFAYNFVH